MGVWGLENLLERDQPSAHCREVDIQALARQYTEQTGKQPLMLVDGRNFLYTVAYPKTEDWLMGGQLHECIANMQTFIDAFKKTGIELMFYFDGAKPGNNRSKWIKKREEMMEGIKKVFDSLKGLGKIHLSLLMEEYNQQPHLIDAFGRFMLKLACKSNVVLANDEVDKEIATFAKKNGCFAIMTQDTNLVIMDSGAHYLSGRHLNLESMTTKRYDGRAYAKVLSLQFQQLPLLATLMGNDMIPYSCLSRYHKGIRGATFNPRSNRPKAWTIIKSIVANVRRQPTGQELLDKLPNIAESVLLDGSSSTALKISVEHYMMLTSTCDDQTPSQDKPGDWADILKEAKNKHDKMEVPLEMWNILFGFPFNHVQSVEDLSIRQWPCAALAYQNLRQHTYSILLKEKPVDNVSVEEWYTCFPNTVENKTILVEPLPDGFEHPGLLTLWSKETSAEDQRWELFLKCVSPYLKTSQVRELPMRLLMPTMVLSYIRLQCNVLENWEVNALLTVAVVMETADMKLIKRQPTNYQPPVRAVQCATLFSRGVTAILLLMAACGFPLDEVMPWLYFDGKLFLTKYLEAKTSGSPEGLSGVQTQQLEAMRNIIFAPELTDQGLWTPPPSDHGNQQPIRR